MVHFLPDVSAGKGMEMEEMLWLGKFYIPFQYGICHDNHLDDSYATFFFPGLKTGGEKLWLSEELLM